MEHSKSYHCLQIQLHCDLRKTLGKTWSVSENSLFPTVYESVFEGCALLGRRLWAVSMVVLQKFRLAVQKYLQKPLATTGASSSSELPCLEAEGCAGGCRAGVMVSFWMVWWRYPSSILHTAGTSYRSPLGLKGSPGSGAWPGTGLA